MSYISVEKGKGAYSDYTSMTIERTSEEELSQVEVLKAGRQTVIEEIITRVEETEKEVVEEKSVAPKISYDEVLTKALSLKAGSSIYIEVRVKANCL